MEDIDNRPSILSKAFELLDAFITADRVMTLSDLARTSGLPKSTVHRLLGRLIQLGALEQQGSGYTVGLQLFRLGTRPPVMAVRDLAMPYLAALHRWCGLTVTFGVLREFDLVVLERISQHTSPDDVDQVGAQLPANCTAMGKALLSQESLDDLEAFLPRPMRRLTPESITDVPALMDELRQIRTINLARDENEMCVGITSVAAPVVVHGSAVGALAVTGAVAAGIDAKVNTALRDAAAHIAKEVRYSLTPDVPRPTTCRR